MYRPLHELPCCGTLANRTARHPEPFRRLIQLQLLEPLAERDIEASLPALTGVEDPVSNAVRQQYEANPYPRWLSTGSRTAKPLGEIVSSLFPHLAKISDIKNILLAGRCLALVASCVGAYLFLWIVYAFFDTKHYLESAHEHLRLERHLQVSTVVLFTCLALVASELFRVVAYDETEGTVLEINQAVVTALRGTILFSALTVVAILLRPSLNTQGYVTVEPPTLGEEADEAGLELKIDVVPSLFRKSEYAKKQSGK